MNDALLSALLSALLTLAGCWWLARAIRAVPAPAARGPHATADLLPKEPRP